MILPASDKHPKILDSIVINPFQDIDLSDLPLESKSFEDTRKGCKYYTFPEFHQGNLGGMSAQSDLTLLHVNSRSILSDCKFEEFQLFLHQSNIEW